MGNCLAKGRSAIGELPHHQPLGSGSGSFSVDVGNPIGKDIAEERLLPSLASSVEEESDEQSIPSSYHGAASSIARAQDEMEKLDKLVEAISPRKANDARTDKPTPIETASTSVVRLDFTVSPSQSVYGLSKKEIEEAKNPPASTTSDRSIVVRTPRDIVVHTPQGGDSENHFTFQDKQREESRDKVAQINANLPVSTAPDMMHTPPSSPLDVNTSDLYLSPPTPESEVEEYASTVVDGSLPAPPPLTTDSRDIVKFIGDSIVERSEGQTKTQYALSKEEIASYAETTKLRMSDKNAPVSQEAIEKHKNSQSLPGKEDSEKTNNSEHNESTTKKVKFHTKKETFTEDSSETSVSGDSQEDAAKYFQSFLSSSQTEKTQANTKSDNSVKDEDGASNKAKNGMSNSDAPSVQPAHDAKATEAKEVIEIATLTNNKSMMKDEKKEATAANNDLTTTTDEPTKEDNATPSAPTTDDQQNKDKSAPPPLPTVAKSSPGEKSSPASMKHLSRRMRNMRRNRPQPPANNRIVLDAASVGDLSLAAFHCDSDTVCSELTYDYGTVILSKSSEDEEDTVAGKITADDRTQATGTRSTMSNRSARIQRLRSRSAVRRNRLSGERLVKPSEGTIKNEVDKLTTVAAAEKKDETIASIASDSQESNEKSSQSITSSRQRVARRRSRSNVARRNSAASPDVTKNKTDEAKEEHKEEKEPMVTPSKDSDSVVEEKKSIGDSPSVRRARNRNRTSRLPVRSRSSTPTKASNEASNVAESPSAPAPVPATTTELNVTDNSKNTTATNDNMSVSSVRSQSRSRARERRRAAARSTGTPTKVPNGTNPTGAESPSTPAPGPTPTPTSTSTTTKVSNVIDNSKSTAATDDNMSVSSARSESRSKVRERRARAARMRAAQQSPDQRTLHTSPSVDKTAVKPSISESNSENNSSANNVAKPNGQADPKGVTEATAPRPEQQSPQPKPLNTSDGKQIDMKRKRLERARRLRAMQH